MDFGLAPPATRTRPTARRPGRGDLGTPAYMAPEQVRRRPPAIGPATDLYAWA